MFFCSHWQYLMGPNWKHIYLEFSFIVRAMVRPPLKPSTEWFCLPFWKVLECSFTSLTSCFHSTIAQKLSQKIDSGLIWQLSWKSKTNFLGAERKIPGCMKLPGGKASHPLRSLLRNQWLNTELSSLLSSGQTVSSQRGMLKYQRQWRTYSLFKA